MSEPEREYEARLLERQNRASRVNAQHALLGNVRLAFVVFCIAVIWFAASSGLSIWPVLAAIAVAVLIALFILGGRWERRIRFAQRGVEYYSRALARVRQRRNEHGETGDWFMDPNHPYAADLDIFGKHSLFQFLSVCRTRAGENLLAQWLQRPATREQVHARHVAHADLRLRLDLREDLAVLGESFRSGVHPEALAQWGIAAPVSISPNIRYVAAALSATGIVLLAGWILTGFNDPRWRIAILVLAAIEASIFFRWREAVNQIAAAASEPGHDLALLSAVLARIEREQFHSPRLEQLHSTLRLPQSASASIARLNRLMELLESRDNWFVRIFGPLILWTTQVSFAVELWRQQNGHAIPQWLDAVAEFEALNSLAALHYEHPEDVLPEMAEGLAFEAEALAHPLLFDCVSNDVTLGNEQALLIVSGSNMSGKSTLLRTIGLNAVLALAGAPVRAKRLRLSSLSIGASIRTADSLDGGISRFYAEILRIRQILDLPRPALFLLDELLAGTNSHDRRIGAEAIFRGLLERGAIGLATTHDLALSSIAGQLAASVNVHFEDTIVEGRMSFDYRMRPGVVTRSNALELMRSVGLEV